MAEDLKPGDKVSWGTSQGETHGIVEQKVTGRAQVKGHVANATRAHPQYKVKSVKTGAEAIHEPEALKPD